MKVTDLAPKDCDLAKSMLAHVGAKWSPLLVTHLADGPQRFSDLRRALPGISQRILTLTLREMERDGLVGRHVTPSFPPRVDYSLTALGQELREAISALGRWSLERADRIAAAQAAFDQKETPGG
ncbi:MAG: hypothetical protein RLZZ437_3059 [Pseudomonadota bacterium]|jgi:DNA-binding HxlR family transcriptional regulator